MDRQNQAALAAFARANFGTAPRVESVPARPVTITSGGRTYGLSGGALVGDSRAIAGMARVAAVTR